MTRKGFRDDKHRSELRLTEGSYNGVLVHTYTQRGDTTYDISLTDDYFEETLSLSYRDEREGAYGKSATEVLWEFGTPQELKLYGNVTAEEQNNEEDASSVLLVDGQTIADADGYPEDREVVGFNTTVTASTISWDFNYTDYGRTEIDAIIEFVNEPDPTTYFNTNSVTHQQL
ncbi:hypothetical protein [Halosegnis longus]|uniref:hypothetical protein n=1 Tax=Halosegnis longus TaxID=2216012 RepID=UPI00129EF3A9|nr:hypothetical protein [Halosegnis longus]